MVQGAPRRQNLEMLAIEGLMRVIRARVFGNNALGAFGCPWQEQRYRSLLTNVIRMRSVGMDVTSPRCSTVSENSEHIGYPSELTQRTVCPQSRSEA